MPRWPRKRLSPKREKITFFSLPGELRNRIYDLVVPELQVTIWRTQPMKSRCFENLSQVQRREYLKKLSPEAYRKVHQIHLRCDVLGPGKQTTKFFRNLLHVSRQTTLEIIPILYSRTQFWFDSMKVLNRFLNNAPSSGVHHITDLQLNFQMYGEPELTQDRQWKHIADCKWLRTCNRIADSMPHLKSLHLNLVIADWPVQLALDARWVRPLLVIKKNGLHHVGANIMHSAFTKRRLESFSQELSDFMMTQEGQEEKMRDAKKRKLLDEPRKALRVLNII